MAKIVKLEPEVKIKKKLPPWKNRVLIDAVKADFVSKHNEKFKKR